MMARQLSAQVVAASQKIWEDVFRSLEEMSHGPTERMLVLFEKENEGKRISLTRRPTRAGAGGTTVLAIVEFEPGHPRIVINDYRNNECTTVPFVFKDDVIENLDQIRIATLQQVEKAVR